MSQSKNENGSPMEHNPKKNLDLEYSSRNQHNHDWVQEMENEWNEKDTGNWFHSEVTTKVNNEKNKIDNYEKNKIDKIETKVKNEIKRDKTKEKSKDKNQDKISSKNYDRDLSDKHQFGDSTKELIEKQNNDFLKKKGDNHQIVSLSKDKYEKLITQFQKFKSQLATERNNSKEYKKQVLEFEQSNQKLKERNELLEFNNKRLEKRCALLQEELNEKGNDTFLSRITTTAISSAWKTDTKILEEELTLKIQENESLHTKIIELKQEHSSTINRMEQDIELLTNDLKQKNLTITLLKEKLAKKKSTLEKERSQNRYEINQLQDQLSHSRNEFYSIQKKMLESNNELDNILKKQDFAVPFNDISENDWNMLNCPPYNKPLLVKSLEFQIYTKNFILNLGKLLNGLWATVQQKISIINNVSETHSTFSSFLSNGSTSSNSYSPMIQFIHDHMMNNNEKIDVAHQKIFSDISSQFDHIINSSQAFLDYKQITFESLQQYRFQCEKLINIFVQYFTFLKRAMLYLVISLQDSKCTSKNQYDSYIKFDFVYMDNSTTLTTSYLKFTEYLKIIMNLLLNSFSMKSIESVQISNTSSQFEYETPNKTKQRTKSVFQLRNKKKSEDKDVSKISNNNVTKMKHSRSLSNVLDADTKQSIIIDDYITSEGTKSSELEDGPTKNLNICIYSFCKFMKEFQHTIELSIKEEHKLDFISTSVKSSNEKIVYIFSKIISLLNSFEENIKEFKQFQKDNTPKFVHGASIDFFYWDPWINGLDKNITIPEESKLKYLIHPPYQFMSANGRSFMNLLDNQFQEDSKSFDNISHATALENKREIEHLNNEKQHFENLNKKYKDSYIKAIQSLKDIISEFSPELTNSPLPNSLIEQEKVFEFNINCLIDIIHHLNEEKSIKFENNQVEKSDENLVETIEREKKLVKEYEKIIKHLEKQVKICDAKAVDYRIDWQKAVVQLEEAYSREKNLAFKMRETKQLLQKIQDELITTRDNYEKQIKLLTNSLIQLQGEKKVTSGFSLDALWSKR